MFFSPKTTHVVLLFGLMATTAQAFTPAFTPLSRQASSFFSALKEPDTMTDTDEQVLFGNPSTDGGTSIEAYSEHRSVDRFGNVLPDPAHLNTKQEDLLSRAKDPVVNKLNTMRTTLQSCPELWKRVAEIAPKQRALLDEHLCDITLEYTFAQMETMVDKSARVFQNLGVQKGMNVAILGENSARWLLADHGIQKAGGASAVRGADAPLDELRYIYEHSDSAGIAVLQGPRLLEKMIKDANNKNMKAPLGLENEKHGAVKTIVLLNKERKSMEQIQELAQQAGVQVALLSDLLQGQQDNDPTASFPTVTRDDLATIVYTSGTTGHPKGVMLTHGNLLHQTGHRLAPTQPYEESEPLPGEAMLSLLPVWHITERAFELWMASRGCSVIYSSIRTFKNDLAKHKPQWLVLVPRVLEKVAKGVQDKFAAGSTVVKTLVKLFTAVSETTNKHKKITNGLTVSDEAPGPLERLASRTIVTLLSPLQKAGNKLVWSKVQDGFGGQLKLIISGGSALAGGLETFYETAGVNICVGYGLTECSPLLAYRRSDANLVTAGCTGKACLDTQVRIVDAEKITTDGPRPSLPIGEAGVVLGKGPQVMKGYYKNPEATAKAVDEYGWFDTGDLGRINPATGDLILTGRAKDTIVLSNGENIEPTPIEDAIMGASPLVDQIMLTGQDGRRLVAVAVLNPTELALRGYLPKGKELQKAQDVVNDPKCTDEDAAAKSKVLNDAAVDMRSSADLKKTLMVDVQQATKAFRKWEQVGDVYMTLEPFAMVNGQLTQSYKVKRAAVQERYQDVLMD